MFSFVREVCKNQTDHEKMEHKCGRPLGLRFNEKTGDLFIADAYLGLLVVGPNGGLANSVATEVEGVPLGFTNGLDIDQQTGVVYFTCSSTRYTRRQVHPSLFLSVFPSETYASAKCNSCLVDMHLAI